MPGPGHPSCMIPVENLKLMLGLKKHGLFVRTEEDHSPQPVGVIGITGEVSAGFFRRRFSLSDT